MTYLRKVVVATLVAISILLLPAIHASAAEAAKDGGRGLAAKKHSRAAKAKGKKKKARKAKVKRKAKTSHAAKKKKKAAAHVSHYPTQPGSGVFNELSNDKKDDFPPPMANPNE